jgi:hypothetical protein
MELDQFCPLGKRADNHSAGECSGVPLAQNVVQTMAVVWAVKLALRVRDRPGSRLRSTATNAKGLVFHDERRETPDPRAV